MAESMEKTQVQANGTDIPAKTALFIYYPITTARPVKNKSRYAVLGDFA